MAAPHHRTPEYRRASKRVKAIADANPFTRCHRCGRRLHEHPPHKDGTPATWHAGHTVDGAWIAGDRWGGLRPEASTCNTKAGGELGNERKREAVEPRTPGW